MRILLFITTILWSSFSWADAPFFVKNNGQWNKQSIAKSDVPGGAIFLEDKAITYHFIDQSQLAHGHDQHEVCKELNGHAIQWRFVKSQKAKIRCENPKEGRLHYFVSGTSVSNLQRYQEVIYEGIYPKIDYRIYTYGDGLKYDWVVAPRGNPNKIRMELEGVEDVRLLDGRIHIKTSVNEIIEEKPYAYQIINGQQVEVACVFVWKQNKLSFDFPNGYDKSKELVIDPILIFSSYSGSTANNFGYTATYDDYGFLYAGGTAFNIGYPTTLGAYSTNYSGGIGGTDIVLSKYDTTGTFLVYSTFLGGAGDEVPHSLIVYEDELYMMGTSGSSDFPTTTGCFDNSFNGGTPLAAGGVGINYTNGCDIVVSRFSTDGSQLLSSTYIGGSFNDGFNSANDLRYNYADQMRGEIDFDSQGNCYIASSTQSNDFPIVSSIIQPALQGVQDGVVVKMDSDLSSIQWSSFWGGINNDAIYSLSFNSADEIFVCGGTKSSNFQTTANAYASTYIGGSVDAFISRFSEDGSSLLNSTFFGSVEYDQAYFIELDATDSVYIYGQTLAPANTLIQNAAFAEPNSGQFVAKFSEDLSILEFSTVFGSGSGAIDISPTAFLVDVCNRIYCSGWGGKTNDFTHGGPGGHTADLTTTPGAFQESTDSSDFYLIIIEDNANTLSYATFFGGNLAAEHVDGGTSRFDRKGVVYQSVCAGCGGFSDFPTTPGAVSTTNNASCNNAVFKFDPEFPLTIANFTAPGVTCDNDVQFTNLSFGNNTYWWDFGDGQNSSAENPNHIFINPGIYEVTLYTSDPTSCNLLDSISKFIEVRTHQSQQLDSLFICKGDTVQLNFSTQADFTYSWTPFTYLDDPNSISPITQPEDSIHYYLIGNLGDCYDTLSQHIAVFEVPLETSTNQEICGNPIWLFAESNDEASVKWSVSPTFSAPQNDSLLASFPGTYFVKAEQYGCQKSVAIEVRLSSDCCTEDKINIPNAFSPNGDGQNDTYFIKDDSNIIQYLELKIFNRWGQKVFQTSEKKRAWDGYFQGKLLNTAVFDYHLNIGCIGGQESFFKKGDITLIR